MQQKRPPPSTTARTTHGYSRSKSKDYSPTTWDAYFDSSEDVCTSADNVFRVYHRGAPTNDSPLLVLLHGGGYSALTWALLADDIVKLIECQVAAVDLRGHGSSRTTDDEDLCAETMSSDVGEILQRMFAGHKIPPPTILVGHSMGGAIAVHASHRQLVPTVVGLVVIDVVEGTAMDALQSMQSFLRGRPTRFNSVPAAIEWCVRTGQVRNLDSVKVSMPGQIKNVSTGKVATDELTFVGSEADAVHSDVGDGHTVTLLHGDGNIPEESEEEEEEEEEEEARPQLETQDHGEDNKCSHSPKKSKTDVFKVPSPTQPAENVGYTWRIDLSRTERYWTGWFSGLSNMFLACSPAKLLLLAGIDRLDKDLTIGQMQGKFQMHVLPQCGHAVHEDVPDKVAEVLASFLVRNKFARPLDTFQGVLPGC